MNKKFIYSILVSTLLITLVTLFSSHLMEMASKNIKTNVCTIENTDDYITIYNRKLIFSMQLLPIPLLKSPP